MDVSHIYKLSVQQNIIQKMALSSSAGDFFY